MHGIVSKRLVLATLCFVNLQKYAIMYKTKGCIQLHFYADIVNWEEELLEMMVNIITWVPFSSLFWLHGPKQCRPIKPADSCSRLTNPGKFLLRYLPQGEWQTAKANRWSWCLCQSFRKVHQEKHLCQNLDFTRTFLGCFCVLGICNVYQYK